MRPRAVKGMKDLFGQELLLHRWVREQAAGVFSAHGFQEVESNLVEEREVFARTLGVSSDVVAKEMFGVGRQGGENTLVLRPENTAGLVRHVLEKQTYKQGVQRLFYCGRMFRYERP